MKKSKKKLVVEINQRQIEKKVVNEILKKKRTDYWYLSLTNKYSRFFYNKCRDNWTTCEYATRFSTIAEAQKIARNSEMTGAFFLVSESEMESIRSEIAKERQNTTQHTEPAPKREIPTISNDRWPSLKECCPKDTDHDGNCPIHSAPGVLRDEKLNRKYRIEFKEDETHIRFIAAEDFHAAACMAAALVTDTKRVVKIEEIL